MAPCLPVMLCGGGAMLKIIREERFLGVAVATSLAFLLFGSALHRDYSNSLYLTLVLAWLFFTILGSVLAVGRHAYHWPERLWPTYRSPGLRLSVPSVPVTA